MQTSFATTHASFTHKLLACGLLAILADFLFYGEKIGWTAGLFCALWLAVAFLFTPHTQFRMKCVVASLTFGQCLALVEQPNLLSLTLASTGIVSTAISHNMRWHQDALLLLRLLVRVICLIPARLLWDNALLGRIKTRFSRRRILPSRLRGWILPIACTFGFALLFSFANPIFSRLFENLDIQFMREWLNIWRLLLIALVFCVSLALLRTKFKPTPERKFSSDKHEGWLGWLFLPQAVFRSLILFNLLFLSQTVMDMLYLWGGVALPEGMNYATYAQNGSYPLIATALLAALFVLIVFRKHNEHHVPKAIKALVYLWIGQNVMLVLSAIARLNLYIEQYSLTYLRMSALIWMGLVAVGLALIVLRIQQNKDNRWLINSNLLTTLMVLYVCSFMPLGQIIATYNVTHSYEVSGEGERLDQYYLMLLDMSSIEAELAYGQSAFFSTGAHKHDWKIFTEKFRRLKERQSDWRSWTFENHRILKRLNAMQAGVSP